MVVRSVSSARRGWVLVETDRGSWMIPARKARSLELSRGAQIATERLVQTAVKSQTAAARRDTGRYLARSEHTESQLEGHLTRKGYLPEVVTETIAWAHRLGYVDDLRYARAYVGSHLGGRSPMGSRRLLLELRKRGVDDSDARRAVEEVDERGMENQLTETVRKRYAHLKPEVARRRAKAFLSRRGFDWDTSRRVLEKALEDLSDASESNSGG